MESSRRFVTDGSLSGKELQRVLEEALAEEELGEATVTAEREDDGLGTVATVIVVWLGTQAAGKVFGKGFDWLWERLLRAVRRRLGDNALTVAGALPVDGAGDAASGSTATDDPARPE